MLVGFFGGASVDMSEWEGQDQEGKWGGGLSAREGRGMVAF